MTIPFKKYHGTGNDFVLIDQRAQQYLQSDDQELIQFICDRRFGIGADGLILLKNHPDFDFEMVYFNADGKTSSMCGNGGRCIVAFAKEIGIIENECSFLAIDGPHQAKIVAGQVSLKMSNVLEINKEEDHFILDTGSPHYVAFVEDVDDINVVENGQAIRYSSRFKKEGINVNFVEKRANDIIVLTYERGVEGETFSCGTGVTAAAIASRLSDDQTNQKVAIKTKGGNLQVEFRKATIGYTNIWLSGPATLVHEGDLNMKAKLFFPNLKERISQ